MKKIINGRRYDTETAQFLGADGYGNYGDFQRWHEELYRKNTGEFFLYGNGGPMSHYAVETGQNEWAGGEKIMPLSLLSAQKWAEEHLDGDKYEEIFGEVDESGEKISQNVRLSPGTVEKVKQAASERGVPLSAVIEEAVLAYIK